MAGPWRLMGADLVADVAILGVRMTDVRHPFVSVSLLAAVEEPGCAFCRLVAEGEQRWLWGFLWESVNDPWIRERIAASWGLCRRHAWMLVAKEQAEWGSSVGTAIVYRDLATRFLEATEASGIGAWRSLLSGRSGVDGKTLSRRLSPRQPCPLCDHARRIVASESYWLPEALPTPRFRRGYSDSDGLCLPHLRQVLSRLDSGADRRFLLDHQERVLLRTASGRDRRPEVRQRRLVSLLGGEMPPLPMAGGESGKVACRCTRCSDRHARANRMLRELGAGVAGGGSEVAEKWRALCGLHIWDAWDCAAGTLGIDELSDWFSSLLADGLARLRTAQTSPSNDGWRRLVPWHRHPAPGTEVSTCPVCAQQEGPGRERGDPEDVPCLPHLRSLSRSDDGSLNGLLAREGAFVRGLVAELDEYLRKHDYRFVHEPKGTEQASIGRAVAFVAGAEPRFCDMTVSARST